MATDQYYAGKIRVKNLLAQKGPLTRTQIVKAVGAPIVDQLVKNGVLCQEREGGRYTRVRDTQNG